MNIRIVQLIELSVGYQSSDLISVRNHTHFTRRSITLANKLSPASYPGLNYKRGQTAGRRSRRGDFSYSKCSWWTTNWCALHARQLQLREADEKFRPITDEQTITGICKQLQNDVSQMTLATCCTPCCATVATHSRLTVTG